MKKTLIITIFILLFGMSACNPNNTETTLTTTTGASTNTTTSVTTSTSSNEETTTLSTANLNIDYSLYENISILNLSSSINNRIQSLDYSKYYTLVYYDEDKMIYLIDNIIYVYEGGNTVEHEPFEEVPVILGYNPDTDIIYMLRYQLELSVDQEVSSIYSYNLSNMSIQIVHTELEDSSVLAMNYNGTVFFIDDEYYIFNNKFEQINHYENVQYLGTSKYVNNVSNHYFLFGEVNGSNCDIIIHDGEQVIETKTISDACGSGEYLDVKSPYVYFIVGVDRYASFNMYRFNPYTLEFESWLSQMNNEQIDYIVDIDTFNGIYEIALEDSHVTFFNDNMTYSQSTTSIIGELFAIGETFYLADVANSSDKAIFDFSRNQLQIFNDTYRSIKTQGDFMILTTNTYESPFFLQTVFNHGTDEILSSITNFQRIDDHSAVYYANITGSTVDVVYQDFSTETSIILVTLQYEGGPTYHNYSSITVYPNGMFMVRDDTTGLSNLYTSTAELIGEYRFLGLYKRLVGSNTFVYLDENNNIVLFKSYIN